MRRIQQARWIYLLFLCCIWNSFATADVKHIPLLTVKNLVEMLEYNLPLNDDPQDEPFDYNACSHAKQLNEIELKEAFTTDITLKTRSLSCLLGHTLLTYFISIRSNYFVKFLIDGNNFDIRIPNIMGYTPLLQTVESDDILSLKHILHVADTKGILLNVIDENGFDDQSMSWPLEKSISLGRREHIQILIDNGASLAKIKDSSDPLMWISILNPSNIFDMEYLWAMGTTRVTEYQKDNLQCYTTQFYESSFQKFSIDNVAVRHTLEDILQSENVPALASYARSYAKYGSMGLPPDVTVNHIHVYPFDSKIHLSKEASQEEREMAFFHQMNHYANFNGRFSAFQQFTPRLFLDGLNKFNKDSSNDKQMDSVSIKPIPTSNIGEDSTLKYSFPFSKTRLQALKKVDEKPFKFYNIIQRKMSTKFKEWLQGQGLVEWSKRPLLQKWLGEKGMNTDFNFLKKFEYDPMKYHSLNTAFKFIEKRIETPDESKPDGYSGFMSEVLSTAYLLTNLVFPRIINRRMASKLAVSAGRNALDFIGLSSIVSSDEMFSNFIIEEAVPGFKETWINTESKTRDGLIFNENGELLIHLLPEFFYTTEKTYHKNVDSKRTSDNSNTLWQYSMKEKVKAVERIKSAERVFSRCSIFTSLVRGSISTDHFRTKQSKESYRQNTVLFLASCFYEMNGKVIDKQLLTEMYHFYLERYPSKSPQIKSVTFEEVMNNFEENRPLNKRTNLKINDLFIFQGNRTDMWELEKFADRKIQAESLESVTGEQDRRCAEEMQKSSKSTTNFMSYTTHHVDELSRFIQDELNCPLENIDFVKSLKDIENFVTEERNKYEGMKFDDIRESDLKRDVPLSWIALKEKISTPEVERELWRVIHRSVKSWIVGVRAENLENLNYDKNNNDKKTQPNTDDIFRDIIYEGMLDGNPKILNRTPYVPKASSDKKDKNVNFDGRTEETVDEAMNRLNIWPLLNMLSSQGLIFSSLSHTRLLQQDDHRLNDKLRDALSERLLILNAARNLKGKFNIILKKYEYRVNALYKAINNKAEDNFKNVFDFREQLNSFNDKGSEWLKLAAQANPWNSASTEMIWKKVLLLHNVIFDNLIKAVRGNPHVFGIQVPQKVVHHVHVHDGEYELCNEIEFTLPLHFASPKSVSLPIISRSAIVMDSIDGNAIFKCSHPGAAYRMSSHFFFRTSAIVMRNLHFERFKEGVYIAPYSMVELGQNEVLGQVEIDFEAWMNAEHGGLYSSVIRSHNSVLSLSSVSFKDIRLVHPLFSVDYFNKIRSKLINAYGIEASSVVKESAVVLSTHSLACRHCKHTFDHVVFSNCSSIDASLGIHSNPKEYESLGSKLNDGDSATYGTYLGMYVEIEKLFDEAKKLGKSVFRGNLAVINQLANESPSIDVLVRDSIFHDSAAGIAFINEYPTSGYGKKLNKPSTIIEVKSSHFINIDATSETSANNQGTAIFLSTNVDGALTEGSQKRFQKHKSFDLSQSLNSPTTANGDDGETSNNIADKPGPSDVVYNDLTPVASFFCDDSAVKWANSFYHVKSVNSDFTTHSDNYMNKFGMLQDELMTNKSKMRFLLKDLVALYYMLDLHIHYSRAKPLLPRVRYYVKQIAKGISVDIPEYVSKLETDENGEPILNENNFSDMKQLDNYKQMDFTHSAHSGTNEDILASIDEQILKHKRACYIDPFRVSALNPNMIASMASVLNGNPNGFTITDEHKLAQHVNDQLKVLLKSHANLFSNKKTFKRCISQSATILHTPMSSHVSTKDSLWFFFNCRSDEMPKLNAIRVKAGDFISLGNFEHFIPDIASIYKLSEEELYQWSILAKIRQSNIPEKFSEIDYQTKILDGFANGNGMKSTSAISHSFIDIQNSREMAISDVCLIDGSSGSTWMRFNSFVNELWPTASSLEILEIYSKAIQWAPLSDGSDILNAIMELSTLNTERKADLQRLSAVKHLSSILLNIETITVDPEIMTRVSWKSTMGYGNFIRQKLGKSFAKTNEFTMSGAIGKTPYVVKDSPFLPTKLKSFKVEIAHPSSSTPWRFAAFVDDCIFTGNSRSHGDGGAIGAHNFDLTVRRSTFIANGAKRGKGGAISLTSSPDSSFPSVLIVKSTFRANSAEDGSSIYADVRGAVKLLETNVQAITEQSDVTEVVFELFHLMKLIQKVPFLIYALSGLTDVFSVGSSVALTPEAFLNAKEDSFKDIYSLLKEKDPWDAAKIVAPRILFKAREKLRRNNFFLIMSTLNGDNIPINEQEAKPISSLECRSPRHSLMYRDGPFLQKILFENHGIDGNLTPKLGSTEHSAILLAKNGTWKHTYCDSIFAAMPKFRSSVSSLPIPVIFTLPKEDITSPAVNTDQKNDMSPFSDWSPSPVSIRRSSCPDVDIKSTVACPLGYFLKPIMESTRETNRAITIHDEIVSKSSETADLSFACTPCPSGTYFASSGKYVGVPSLRAVLQGSETLMTRVENGVCLPCVEGMVCGGKDNIKVAGKYYCSSVKVQLPRDSADPVKQAHALISQWKTPAVKLYLGHLFMKTKSVSNKKKKHIPKANVKPLDEFLGLNYRSYTPQNKTITLINGSVWNPNQRSFPPINGSYLPHLLFPSKESTSLSLDAKGANEIDAMNANLELKKRRGVEMLLSARQVLALNPIRGHEWMNIRINNLFRSENEPRSQYSQHMAEQHEYESMLRREEENQEMSKLNFELSSNMSSVVPESQIINSTSQQPLVKNERYTFSDIAAQKWNRQIALNIIRHRLDGQKTMHESSAKKMSGSSSDQDSWRPETSEIPSAYFNTFDQMEMFSEFISTRNAAVSVSEMVFKPHANLDHGLEESHKIKNEDLLVKWAVHAKRAEALLDIAIHGLKNAVDSATPVVDVIHCSLCPEGFCPESSRPFASISAPAFGISSTDSMCDKGRTGTFCSSCVDGKMLSIGSMDCKDDCTSISGTKVMLFYGFIYVIITLVADAGSSSFFKTISYFLETVALMDFGLSSVGKYLMNLIRFLSFSTAPAYTSEAESSVLDTMDLNEIRMSTMIASRSSSLNVQSTAIEDLENNNLIPRSSVSTETLKDSDLAAAHIKEWINYGTEVMSLCSSSVTPFQKIWMPLWKGVSSLVAFVFLFLVSWFLIAIYNLIQKKKVRRKNKKADTIESLQHEFLAKQLALGYSISHYSSKNINENNSNTPNDEENLPLLTNSNIKEVDNEESEGELIVEPDSSDDDSDVRKNPNHNQETTDEVVLFKSYLESQHQSFMQNQGDDGEDFDFIEKEESDRNILLKRTLRFRQAVKSALGGIGNFGTYRQISSNQDFSEEDLKWKRLAKSPNALQKEDTSKQISKSQLNRSQPLPPLSSDVADWAQFMDALPWWARYIRVLILVLLLIYQPLVTVLFQVVDCESYIAPHYDGYHSLLGGLTTSWVLKRAPTVECMQDWQWVVQLIGIPFLSMTCLIVYLLVEKSPRRTAMGATITSTLEFPFRTAFRWWEAVQTIRRFMFASSAVFFRSEADRALAFVLNALIFLTLSSYFKPFQRGFEQITDILTLLSVALIAGTSYSRSATLSEVPDDVQQSDTMKMQNAIIHGIVCLIVIIPIILLTAFLITYVLRICLKLSRRVLIYIPFYRNRKNKLYSLPLHVDQIPFSLVREIASQASSNNSLVVTSLLDRGEDDKSYFESVILTPGATLDCQILRLNPFYETNLNSIDFQSLVNVASTIGPSATKAAQNFLQKGPLLSIPPYTPRQIELQRELGFRSELIRLTLRPYYHSISPPVYADRHNFHCKEPSAISISIVIPPRPRGEPPEAWKGCYVSRQKRLICLQRAQAYLLARLKEIEDAALIRKKQYETNNGMTADLSR